MVRQLTASHLAREGLVEVVVVDNHSPPHWAIRRLRRHPGVSLRRWKHNYGYARAVNEGSRLSRGQWVLALNPDVAVHDQFLRSALEEAERLLTKDPRAGVVGFRLRHGDGTEQLSSGAFPTLLSTFSRLLLSRSRRKYRSPGLNEAQPVPWVTGCCMLIRKECLRDLGGFDVDYFLYYEDVDFCRRAWDAGWSVWYRPFPEAVHHRPLHRRELSARLRVFTRHALLTYAAKHWKTWELQLMAAVVRLEALLRQAVADWKEHPRDVAYFKALGRICAIWRRVRIEGLERASSELFGTRSLMAQPELSIVIPTYNRSDLLATCLRSVRQHAPRETEIIVVDDGSRSAKGWPSPESSACRAFG